MQACAMRAAGLLVAVCVLSIGAAHAAVCIGMAAYTYDQLLALNCTHFSPIADPSGPGLTVIISGIAAPSLVALSSIVWYNNPFARSGDPLSFRCNCHFVIRDNPNLTSLYGLLTLASVQNMTVESNPKLASLAGLEYTSVYGALTIAHNPALTTMQGLNATGFTTVTFAIRNNSALVNCDGMGGWLGFTSFSLTDMPALISIAGMPGPPAYMHAFGDPMSFTVSNNPQLTDMTALPRILSEKPSNSGTFTLTITNNPALTAISDCTGWSAANTFAVVLSGNNALTEYTYAGTMGGYVLNIQIMSNAALQHIGGFYVPSSSISTSIVISACPSLVHLDAFANIGGLASLEIDDCVALETIDTFTALTEVSNLLSLSNLISLTKLVNFLALSNVRELEIQDCTALTSLDGLNAVRQIYDFTLNLNSKLRDFNAMIGWPYPTNGAHFISVCCAPYTFFAATTAWTHENWSPCDNCVAFTAYAPNVVPTTGGWISAILFVGLLQSATVMATVNSTQLQPNPDSSCTVLANATTGIGANMSGVLICESSPLPAGTYTLRVQQLPNAFPARDTVPVMTPAGAPVLLFALPFNRFFGGVDVTRNDSYLPAYARDSDDSSLDGSDSDSHTSYVAYINTWLVSVVGSTVATALILLFAVHYCTESSAPPSAPNVAKSERCCFGLCSWATIRSYDPFLMSELNNAEAIANGSVMIHRRSTFGGSAFILIIIAGVTLMSAFLISVSLDNTVVTESYRPSRNSARRFRTGQDFNGSFTFEAMHGPCGHGEEYAGAWTITSDLAGGETTISSARTERLMYANTDRAPVNVSDCTITYTCGGCYMPENTAKLAIQSVDTNAFALGASWAFAGRDHLGDLSTVGGRVVPLTGYLFRGKPSTAAATVVPTAYSTYADSDDASAGVLMEWQAQTAGSFLAPALFPQANGGGLGFELDLNTFGATLQVSVTQRQSWTGIVAQILAIISGTWTVGKVLVSAAQVMCYRRSPREYHRVINKTVMDAGVEMRGDTAPASGGSINSDVRLVVDGSAFRDASVRTGASYHKLDS